VIVFDYIMRRSKQKRLIQIPNSKFRISNALVAQHEPSEDMLVFQNSLRKIKEDVATDFAPRDDLI
jgi:hypothetical protein